MAFVWEMLGLCQAIDFKRQFGLKQPIEQFSAKARESGDELKRWNYGYWIR
jgi:hypothetical protein